VLFARRRDLFSGLQLVFLDTTSIDFEGEGGDTLGRRGHGKDLRPDLEQMVVGLCSMARGGRSAASSARARPRVSAPIGNSGNL
jgi:hypothetical protein